MTNDLIIYFVFVFLLHLHFTDCSFSLEMKFVTRLPAKTECCCCLWYTKYVRTRRTVRPKMKFENKKDKGVVRHTKHIKANGKTERKKKTYLTQRTYYM